MPTPLLLGPVAFQDFEIPERIAFGGAQRLAIHRLPGGGRVIDAMGRDDAEITWSGIFSGPDAADRARALDLLRVDAAPLPLTWDAFLYTVVVARFDAEYTSPWWIPYRIVCTVLRDEAQSLTQSVPDLLVSLGADLGAASAGWDVSASQSALAMDGAAITGTAAHAAALTAVTNDRAALETGLANAGAGLTAADVPSLLATTGQLAQLATARGYLARAQVNLANAST